ncbi:MAG: hypothetical protein JNM56_37445 [Planctomycetia bacterium]|nr:hypothetical protein [Planctomycetia bacterium]
MGSVRFACACGQFSFLDSTDNRSYVAHFIPDQDWDRYWTAIDDAVETSGPTAAEKAAASMALRRYRARLLWQCPVCGSLYVEDESGQPRRFVPEAATVPRRLLQREP